MGFARSLFINTPSEVYVLRYIFAVILTTVPFLLFAACTADTRPDLTLGVTENGVYSNAHFGFSVIYPADFYVLSESDNAEIMGISTDDIPDTLPNLRTLQLFAAYRHNPRTPDPDAINPSLIITAEKTALTETEYLTTFFAYLQSASASPWFNVRYTSGVITPTDINGTRFHTLTATGIFYLNGAPGLHFTQIYHSAKLHGYILTLSFLHEADEIIPWSNEILNTFSFDN
jgi:hypothetical protein